MFSNKDILSKDLNALKESGAPGCADRNLILMLSVAVHPISLDQDQEVSGWSSPPTTCFSTLERIQMHSNAHMETSWQDQDF